jgi:hypothetical protein
LRNKIGILLFEVSSILKHVYSSFDDLGACLDHMHTAIGIHRPFNVLRAPTDLFDGHSSLDKCCQQRLALLSPPKELFFGVSYCITTKWYQRYRAIQTLQ